MVGVDAEPVVERRVAFPAAIVLHVGIYVSWTVSPFYWFHLAVFNGMMVAIVWAVTREESGIG